MLKKTLFALLCATLIFLTQVSFNRPIFEDYSDSTEVYTCKSGSLCTVTTVENFRFPLLSGVKGQSAVIKEDFDFKEFLKKFDAKIVHEENTEFGVSYYAYSPKIKYCELVCGKRVNLHVFTGSQVKVGSPIIYGSY